MNNERCQKAAYAIYYAADGSVVKRVDFQEPGKHVTSKSEIRNVLLPQRYSMEKCQAETKKPRQPSLL